MPEFRASCRWIGRSLARQISCAPRCAPMDRVLVGEPVDCRKNQIAVRHAWQRRSTHLADWPRRHGMGERVRNLIQADVACGPHRLVRDQCLCSIAFSCQTFRGHRGFVRTCSEQAGPRPSCWPHRRIWKDSPASWPIRHGNFSTKSGSAERRNRAPSREYCRLPLVLRWRPP